MTSSRKSIKYTSIAGRSYKYGAPQRILPLLNMLTPFARSKVLYELKKMRFVNVEIEDCDWLFIVDCGKHYVVDISTCECNCRIFVTFRYPCRHMLLAYVNKRILTAHQILKHCSRWKLDNTHNFQNNTPISLLRWSKEYMRIQRRQAMYRQQILEKYGVQFAKRVERKVYNYYLRLINN